MKILTIGSGFIADHLPYKIMSERLAVDAKQISAILDYYKPEAIVNCIGKTGRPNIDWCESHKVETSVANVAIPLLLAEACEKRSIHMVQVGSGCIYSGSSPSAMEHYQMNCFGGNGHQKWTEDTGWKEDNYANPVSYYSKSKYACDLILGELDHVTTLRIRMPISTKNHPRNLINKLKGYSHIIDIPNSVTFMDDLVRCVDWTIQNRLKGVFHVTNPTPLTAVQVMREYQKYVPSHTFEIISGAELDAITSAKRSNCITDSSKLSNAGFTMTPSDDALKSCMMEYIKNI
jgi:3,5-epimerase/4-reductase